MRIAIVAFTVSHAGGEYTAALAQALAGRASVAAWIPDHPPLPMVLPKVDIRTFAKPRSRRNVAVAEMWGAVHSRVGRDIVRWKPDVVHVVFGDGYPSALSLSRLCAARGVPLALTVHDPEPHPGSGWARIQHAVSRRAMRHAAGIAVHCQAQLTQLPARARSRFVFGHPTLPCPACSGPPHTGAVQGDGVIFFGRFSGYKGLDTLAEAMALNYVNGETRRLTLLGTGEVPQEMRDLARRWPDRVNIRQEFLPRTDLHAVLLDHEICVLPYRQATQSAAPYWAAAHACHVVATRIGCLGEVVADLGGTVVPPGSVQALSDALRGDVRCRSTPNRPLPTFDDMANELMAWYSTLAGARG